MKQLIRFLVISFFVLGMVSCSSDNDGGGSSTSTTFKATMNGTSEVPSNASAATGNATLVFNNTSKILP